jgi:hypothetical protein
VSGQPVATSTVHGLGSDPDPIDRWFQRGLAVVLAVVLAVGVLGAFGPTTGRAHATRGGTDLTVEYPTTIRPGLAAPFTITIESAAPLADRVPVSVSEDYLAMFDENGIDPDPVESWNDGETVTWVFAPVGNERRLSVSLDARIEPGVQTARNGLVTALTDGPAVAFTTFVMP